MAVDPNVLGERGEGIVVNLLTRRHGRQRPFFRLRFLGDKYPIIDYFVELIDAPYEQRPYFFIQVKATTRGVTSAGELRLPIRITAGDMASLASYPAPTYIVGVDESGEAAYIRAVLTGHRAGISGMAARHSLADVSTLVALYDEVARFWRTASLAFDQSRFL